MASASGATRLRTRLVLTMILGAIVPLGVIGLWTTRSASTSGRTLLRSQLEAQLAQTRGDVEDRWARRKSDLLSLAENEPVRQALRDSTMSAIPAFAQRAFAQMTSFNRIVFKDAQGRTRWTLEGPNAGSTMRDVRDAAELRGIAVRLPISDLFTGETIGSVEASLRSAALFPVTTGPAPREGPLIAAFPRGDGPIVPPGADDRLFRDESVAWSGHHWLTVRRAMAEPPMDLAVAGALDSYVDPFRSTARTNAAVLLAAAALALIVVVTLTNRVAREVERELAQREALAAVGEFASELAHEVRNPLTAIRLDLQRVEELATDAAVVRGIVPRVLRQVERLDRAVTGALRVSRGVSIHQGSIQLTDVLDAAGRAAEPEFAHRTATLTINRESVRDIHLDADADALHQLFLNLLINAAQSLTSHGEARVSAFRRNEWIDVTIADNGAGMTPQQLAAATEPYRSSKRNGTGLGLKIARRIVTSHGGRMTLASNVGGGTTVVVTLPAQMS